MTSFIIPLYNAEKTIARTLDSLLAQTEPHFEILVIDDASTDRGCDIVEAYAQKDARIRLIRKEHGGVSAARNRGLAEAQGEYIQFIDADDSAEPDMLETLLSNLLRTKADISICDFYHPCLHSSLGDCVLDLTRKRNLLRYFQNTFSNHVPWNKLYRREVIRTPFDESVHFSEDGLFALANLRNARRLVSTSRKLYHYYVAPPSPDGQLSCISRIAQAPAEGEHWETFGYMIMRMLPQYQREIDRQFKKADREDFLYVRTFDFMLWDLALLSALGASERDVTRDILAVFSEPVFLHSVRVKEKYGIRCRIPHTEEEVSRYVKVSLFAYAEAQRRGLNPFHVLLSVFAYLFVERAGVPLDRDDLLTSLYADVRANRTPIARFVRSLFPEKRTATYPIYHAAHAEVRAI